MPLAERFGAPLHLVHVQPIDEMAGVTRAGRLLLNCADAIAVMQGRLDGFRRKERPRFLPENCPVVRGRPFEEICKLASEIGADLIVLPTRGYSGLKHVMLGSTAERVVRYASCPVMVLRGKGVPSILLNESPRGNGRMIVAPVDFSRCSMAGVRYAARLAKTSGALLRLVHVVFPFSEMVGMDRLSANATSLLKAAKRRAVERMAWLGAMTFLDGVRCETEIRAGSVTDELCAASARPETDVLVISTHGRTGFRRAVLGSVAERVVRYARCPVITVPSHCESSRVIVQ